MTPEEKAERLINKFGKDLAYDVADEMLTYLEYYHKGEIGEGCERTISYKFWLDVNYLIFNEIQTTIHNPK